MKQIDSIEIHLDDIEPGLTLGIYPKQPSSLFDAEDSAAENGEARYQLVEGHFYDFSFNDENFTLGDVGEQIVRPHSRNKHNGTLAPNIFVGTLYIPIIRIGDQPTLRHINLEVQSIKSEYRDEYRDMLEFITEKCTGILLQANSPVSQHFEVDYTKDIKTLYQKFAFIRSVIGTDEFAEAVHRIVSFPVTKWTDKTEDGDIRNSRRLSNSAIRELLSKSNRTKLPDAHPARKYGITSLPVRISQTKKADSVDTPENRFIKHTLGVFLKFCTDINHKAEVYNYTKLRTESEILIRELESQLHHTIFNHISRATTLKLNSPVLQRKEGYREVLRVWLMFDLAAKLIWTGGEDVYEGGKKDVATLYEYWLFFKLLGLMQDLYQIDYQDISELITETPDGLNLRLKQGKSICISGVLNSVTRKLHVRFHYNRSFSGNREYPSPGSWTTALRPDYTISYWPFGITEKEAEIQELIVHVHFDAKYKVSNIKDLFISKDEGLDEQKLENRKGIYKNADLLKMHAYKDAIRRTAGAYVIYPGGKSDQLRGFHEIVPGLGAFAVKPSRSNSGIGKLKAFLKDLTEHLQNRISQREKYAFKTYTIHRDEPRDMVNTLLPEAYNQNRGLIPDQTYVLIGYYRSEEQLRWIEKNKLYNFRMGSGVGSITFDQQTVNSRYLLLHTKGDKCSGNIWRIVGNGPRIFSKKDLLNRDYPSPSQDNYVVFSIEPVKDPEFRELEWDFRKLKNYSKGRASSNPFTASLSELMTCRIGTLQ